MSDGKTATPAAIVIVDYDPLWPHHFATLRLRIAAALGELTAAIEHVGSTAVPGLAAKPVIDIDVLLRSPCGLLSATARLDSCGYRHRGDLGVAGREAFRQPPGDIEHHLYVCLPDSREYRRHIAFRDYLRAHREDVDAYALLKRELARKFATDREAYNRAKTSFVEEILARAARIP